MSWTAHENAIYIRRAVQTVQDLLGFPVHDGKYTRDLHEAYRAALVKAGQTRYGDPGEARAAELDNHGPSATDLFTDAELSYDAAKAFRLAWAWWSRLRGRPPYPTSMAYVIADWNEYEADGGSLTIKNARDLDLFVGDGQSAGAAGSRTIWYVVGGLLGAATLGYMGLSYGRSSCPAVGR